MSTSNLRSRLPEWITVVEVGPRDGLQNQQQIVPTAVKIEFISRLSNAGLQFVEATSFVNPSRVPQLADADEVLRGIERKQGVSYPVLVANETGLDRAVAAGAREIAIFASATEEFSRRNLARTRAEAMYMFRPVVKRAHEEDLRVRGYLSMVFGDPWEGDIAPAQVAAAALELKELGCFEVSLGDTTGVGTPGRVQDLIGELLDRGMPQDSLAVHFHDTYGQALANVLAALEMGVTVVDSSAGGLGGCPFAESATGNLATEDLIWMCNGLGIETGVDVAKVAAASNWLCAEAGIPLPGRVARALA